MRRRLRAVALVAGGSLAPWVASAQLPSLSAYVQDVAIGSAAGAGMSAGALDVLRARLMGTARGGPLSFEAAYEQVLWLRDARSTGAAGGLLSSTRSGGDWLPLAWTIHDGDHLSWGQRFDRLAVSYSRGTVTATVGRQAISWGTTLLLTPADPFVPFDPSDPFREYRVGVDAARVQWFAGPFTVFDVVVRAAESAKERTVTALVRGKTTVRGWEFSAWGGAIHDAPGAAAGLTRAVAGSAVRAEVEVRRDSSGHTVGRAAIGVDRRFTVAHRDLYALVEYQHDPFGALHAADLPAAATSLAAQRRELPVLGRDESAVQVTYQVHPLVSAELLALWNLRDASMLLAPAAALSLSDEATLRAGVFVPAGAVPGPAGPRSEYGAASAAGYLAFSVFF